MKLENIYLEQKSKAELYKAWSHIRNELLLITLSRVIIPSELIKELDDAVEHFMANQKGVDINSQEMTEKIVKGVRNELLTMIEDIYGDTKHKKSFKFELPVEKLI